jgi:hypothetical protein
LQRQNFSKQSRIHARSETLRQQGIKFVQLHLRCIVVRERSGTLHLAYDGEKGAIRVLRRAEIP